jgi:hypothetical protein
MKVPLQHSKLGIASVLIAIVVWGYFLLLGTLLLKTELANNLFPKDMGFIAQAAAFLLIILFVLLLPLAGFLAGLVFGIFGIFQKTRKRVFAVIGLILNVLPLIFGVIYNLV